MDPESLFSSLRSVVFGAMGERQNTQLGFSICDPESAKLHILQLKTK